MANTPHEVTVDDVWAAMPKEIMLAAATAGSTHEGKAKKLTFNLQEKDFLVYQLQPNGVSDNMDWVKVFQTEMVTGAVYKYNQL